MEAEPRKIISYTPGFTWIVFRRSYRQIACEHPDITQMVLNYLIWKATHA
ncbi:MAG: hypothetical protein ACR2H5_23885 [Ktedonobacteraceae bacterium]